MSATSNNLDQLRAKTGAAIGNVKNDLGNAAADIKESAADVKDNIAKDFSDLLQSARQSGRAELAAAADRLSGYVDSIGESAAALGKRGKETAQAAIDTTDTYVQENPWQAVAVGAGVGALLGFAIGCMAARR